MLGWAGGRGEREKQKTPARVERRVQGQNHSGWVVKIGPLGALDLLPLWTWAGVGDASPTIRAQAAGTGRQEHPGALPTSPALFLENPNYLDL